MTIDPTNLTERPEISDLIEAGALFYFSHSGGKDSQAAYSYMLELGIPADQIIVVHSDLGRIEWDGTEKHIRSTILPQHALNVVHAKRDFLALVWDRYLKNVAKAERTGKTVAPCWPSAETRNCTSDLKRAPIHSFIKQHTDGLRPEGVRRKDWEPQIVVNVMGFRRFESKKREAKGEWSANDRGLTSPAKNRWAYDWCPIFNFTEEDVFLQIRQSGQQPHEAYGRGSNSCRQFKNERLSCQFCILASDNDLAHGALSDPDLFREYVAMEQRTGFTMFHKESLEQRVRRQCEAWGVEMPSIEPPAVRTDINLDDFTTVIEPLALSTT
jgi:3'-phosphoadenosine 5'-phosphosulfate sulfotransferase (PAPS reductase)/FAD synthetase